MLAGTIEKNEHKKTSLVLTRNSPHPGSDHIHSSDQITVPMCCLQEFIPLRRERHRLLCSPVFTPWPNLETPQEDTRQEEDSQSRLQWQVRVGFQITLTLFSYCLWKQRVWDCIWPFFSFCEIFYHRFEFDVSLEEAQTRKLDVAVKNNKMFHTRERKDIGMVRIAACERPCLF